MLLGLLVAGSAVAESRAANYALTVIAAGPGFAFRSGGMNDSGQVAYAESGVVYRWDGGTPLPVYASPPSIPPILPFSDEVGDIAIDDAGIVYFKKSFFNQYGAEIYATTGSGAQAIFGFFGNQDGYYLANLTQVRARGNGELSFQASVAAPTGSPETILVRDGGVFRTIFSEDGVALREVAQGANGQVAFWLSRSVGHEGIYRAEPTGALIAIATSASGNFSCRNGRICLGMRASIDDAGNVAFRGLFDARPGEPEVGVFIGNGVGPPSMVVDSSGPFAAFDAMHLSRSGKLIFTGSLDATPSAMALFAGPDPAAHRIVGTGDALLDSTIAYLAVMGFNDAGQIAFFATLANGKSAVVRADPVPAPSATLGGVASLAAIALLSARHPAARDRADRRRASPSAVRAAAAASRRAGSTR
jgi:hypothetical protein